MHDPAKRALPQVRAGARALERWLFTFTEGAIEAVLPPVCAACGRIGREPFCVLCEAALEPAPPFAIEGARAAVALYLHGGPAQLAVHALKYQGRAELGRPLGRALVPLCGSLGPPEVAVPVPLARARLVARGYNQSRELLRGLGLPVRSRAIVRTGDAAPQVGLDRAARRANLARALSPGPDRVAGRSVLLVDDVVTTGATAEAAVRVLLDAGARDVAVLAFTRAE